MVCRPLYTDERKIIKEEKKRKLHFRFHISTCWVCVYTWSHSRCCEAICLLVNWSDLPEFACYLSNQKYDWRNVKKKNNPFVWGPFFTFRWACACVFQSLASRRLLTVFVEIQLLTIRKEMLSRVIRSWVGWAYADQRVPSYPYQYRFRLFLSIASAISYSLTENQTTP